jgi:cysteine desulfurase / selenocysteine lyase
MKLSKELLRQQFPMFKKIVHGHPLVYLDSAATSLKPNAVIDAMSSFYREHYATVHRSVYKTAQEAEQMFYDVRKKVQSFLNAPSEQEIIFTRGTTDAINLVAACYGRTALKEGDEIAVSEMEHHSNLVPWQMIAKEKGLILRKLPFLANGTLCLETAKVAITPKTKLVAVSHISNTLGTCNPIQELSCLCAANGAKLLVDGAQSAPHIPCDVSKLGCDFFAFSGHKMLGPTGVGCLWACTNLLENMPPYQGGGDMIESVSFESSSYNSIPLKFEAGTPMIAEVIGLGAALDFLNAIGMAEIQQEEEKLLDILLERFEKIPQIQILGPKKPRGSLITFFVQGQHPLDIATLLDLKGIAIRSGHLCAQPVMHRFDISSALRVSWAFYNTPQELHYFCDCLENVITQLSEEKEIPIV